MNKSDDLKDAIEDLKSKIEEMGSKVNNNENEINSNCVKWEDLNETFNQQILNPEVEKTYSDQREKYPKYFKALEHISSYNDKLEEIGNSINDTNKQIDNVNQKTGKII